MSNDVLPDPAPMNVPASAAEAWAAVYIDIAEKLIAVELQESTSETSPIPQPSEK